MTEPVPGPPLPPLSPLPRPREERWLVWYMRGLACVFLISGLFHWQTILGTPGFPSLADLSAPRQALTGYLAVVGLVAAVGLWLAAAWGTVLWLMAALFEIVAYVALRDLFGTDWERVGFHLASMAIYVLVAWRAARKGED